MVNTVLFTRSTILLFMTSVTSTKASENQIALCCDCDLYSEKNPKCHNFHLNLLKIVLFLIKTTTFASKPGPAQILSQLQYRRIHRRYDKVNYMDIMGLYRPILAYNMSFMIKYRQYDKRARSNRLQIIILRLIANLFKIF